MVESALNQGILFLPNFREQEIRMQRIFRITICAAVINVLCFGSTNVAQAQVPWASSCIGFSGQDHTFYVDGSVTMSGFGTSWSTAYKTLQEALAAADAAHAIESSESILIKVADGFYWPDTFCDNPDATFLIRGRTKVHGSFRGQLGVGEPGSPDDLLNADLPVPVLAPSTRFAHPPGCAVSIKHIVTIEDAQWSGPPTVFPSDLETPTLSGVSMGGVGVADHPGALVLIQGDQHKSVVIDQVEFIGGFAPGSSNPGGGAVHISNESSGFPIQFTRCRFFANMAQTNGGAVRNDGSNSLTFYLCDFRFNHTTVSDDESNPDTSLGRGRGGDIFSKNSSSVNLFACRFAQSESVDGASVFIDEGVLRAVSCDWVACWGHTEDPPSGIHARGGAVFTRADADGDEDWFENCVFVQNGAASGQGSALFLNNPSRIKSCTIAYSGGNRATGRPEASPDILIRPEGSAVFFNDSATSSSIENSILWQNYRWVPASSGYLSDLVAQVGWNSGGGLPSVSYSNVQDLVSFPGITRPFPDSPPAPDGNRLGVGGSVNNLDNDPLFIRNANYYVYIPTRSPCYDTGNNSLTPSTTSDPGDVNANCSFAAMVGFDVHKYVDGIPGNFQSRVFNGLTIDMGAIEVPWCLADLDNGSGDGIPDGGVDINDFVFFLTHFEIGDKPADVNGDGGVTIDDLVLFLLRFENGC